MRAFGLRFVAIVKRCPTFGAGFRSFSAWLIGRMFLVWKWWRVGRFLANVISGCWPTSGAPLVKQATSGEPGSASEELDLGSQPLLLKGDELVSPSPFIANLSTVACDVSDVTVD
jgi:hypothetical protein